MEYLIEMDTLGLMILDGIGAIGISLRYWHTKDYGNQLMGKGRGI